MTTATAAAPRIAGGRPAYMHAADCQTCSRLGLPVLLVTSSVVDKGYTKMLKDAGYAFQPGFDPELAKLPCKATIPVIRLLPAGFVFVFYDKRGVWDVWQSFNDATYKKLLEQVTPEEYARLAPTLTTSTGESVCSRGSANLPAGLITLTGASNQPAVWIAFSRHLWTPPVLSSFHTDSHGRRNEQMTLVWAQTWFDGGSIPGKGCTPLNEEGLKHNVIEFNDTVPPAGRGANPLVKAFRDACVPLGAARFGQARAMAEKVRALERSAGAKAENKAIVAFVRDDIGMADQYAAMVDSAHAGYLSWTGNGPMTSGRSDPDWAWKHQLSVVFQ